MKEKIERVPMYIKGLDDEIEGGIPKGFINLICGVAGTMKSSIIFNVLYNEARFKGKNSFYISIEQSFENFSVHLANLGIDLSKINIALATINPPKLNFIDKEKKDTGTIIFMDVPSIREKIIKTRKYEGDLINLTSSMIDEVSKFLKYDFFVLDSLNAVYAISEIKKPRETLFSLFEFLRSKNLTSYLILETPLDRKLHDYLYGVEDYLADSVIFVDLARYGRIVQRELLIRKMRATKSNTNVFTLAFNNGQFIAVHAGEIPVIGED